jgi:hypothetical protein
MRCAVMMSQDDPYLPLATLLMGTLGAYYDISYFHEVHDLRTADFLPDIIILGMGNWRSLLLRHYASLGTAAPHFIQLLPPPAYEEKVIDWGRTYLIFQQPDLDETTGTLQFEGFYSALSAIRKMRSGQAKV